MSELCEILSMTTVELERHLNITKWKLETKNNSIILNV